MPVSHLGLTVSDLPSATAFYLATLAPLGYRYIASRGGDVGLGIHEADFFLRQAERGTPITPTHVAFAANDRITVRSCYTAGLNAGGEPSGQPNYRDQDCVYFNAAVTDFDGNTVEFISKESRVLDECPTGRASAARRGDFEERRSVPYEQLRRSSDSRGSIVSKAQSTAKTALELASIASAITAKQGSSAPRHRISRSQTEPVNSAATPSGNAIVGTLLGAAAGAALAFAMGMTERENAAEERRFAASVHSSDRRAQSFSGKSGDCKSSGRRQGSTSSGRDARRPSLASEKPVSGRQGPQRSRTYDDVQHKPSGSRSGAGDWSQVMRGGTLAPRANRESKGQSKTSRPSAHGSRCRSITESDTTLHDSGVSMHSHRSSLRKTDTATKAATRRSHSAADDTPRATKSRSHISAAKVPQPQSRTTSYISAARVAMPLSHTIGGYAETIQDESDGLDDCESLRPDDSISCVDFSSHGIKKPTGSQSRRPSKQSESVRYGGSRHSVKTLPVRLKKDSEGWRNRRRSNAR
ncbi:hypothetical protein BDY17DRAFT_299922 [Neohortaea acidophila]|uniref:VOC domain-containing protein n=1 Tax=Neohortaea acidophila TaxID=245834 RepID=A0A6A6PPR9_9PEZI|nr:uncharacterized protein BDY17DRAFT_299922 [Neohortaea acidophila]KAF2481915.1 hypothetical protein BDY17DRAFT_299922 [Neohortaea acidophila]